MPDTVMTSTNNFLHDLSARLRWRMRRFVNTRFPELVALAGYVRDQGRIPNLIKPALFNDVIITRRIAKVHPLTTKSSCKRRAKEYIRDGAGPQYVVEDFGAFDDPDDVPWADIDYPVIVKPTSGWAQNYFFNGPEEVTAAKRAQMRGWLKETLFEREGAKNYRGLRNQLLVERKLASDPETGELLDYKVHCFHGVPRFVGVSIGRHTNLRMTFHTPDWKVLPFGFDSPQYEGEFDRPPELDEILEVARKLSAPFKYVRVDFYIERGRVFVGELTHYPGTGLLRITSRKWEAWMGSFYDAHAKDGRI